jgi:hypothetical protein
VGAKAAAPAAIGQRTHSPPAHAPPCQQPIKSSSPGAARPAPHLALLLLVRADVLLHAHLLPVHAPG